MEPAETPTFQPRLRVLNREQALAIHNAALEILEKTGFRMEHPGVVEMLTDAGCKVTNGDWLRLPAYLVEAALASAPKQLVLYDQRGNKTMPLVGGTPFYGTGSDATFTLDLETGQRRRVVLEDVANFARLVDGLENIAFAMLPYVINTGHIEAVDEYYRTLDTVTREDMREAARQFLVDNTKAVVLMVQKEGDR